jgi:hypothetical protein
MTRHGRIITFRGPGASRRAFGVGRLLVVLPVVVALLSLSIAVAVAAGATAPPKGPRSVGVVGPDASPTTPGLQYFYADSSEWVTATGAFGTFLVEDPTVSVTDYHSLVEMSVQSSDQQQTVEVGWMVDPLQFGDALPHLFVSDWVNGSPGCFDGCGFVPTSTTVTAGMVLIPGDTDVFEIAYANSSWNIYDNGTLVGYFPGALWSGTFTFFGLTQWFGEVAAGSSVPCSRMGSGAYAGASGADTINAMGLVGGPTVSIRTSATNDALYTAEATSSNSLSFGGPGGCAAFLGSSTAITSTAPSNPVADQAIKVGVSVTAPARASGATTPTGSVTISDDHNSCQAALSGSNGTATGTCSITEQAAGNYSLTASYPGDDNFDSSATPRSTSVTVGQATPSTPTISNLPTRVTYGGGFTATVSTNGDGAMSVSSNSTSVCTVSGLVVSYVGVGRCSLTAHIGAGTDYNAADGSPQSFAVDKATSAVNQAMSETDLKLSAAKVTYGDEGVEHLSVTVSPEFVRSTPTGTVTVKESTTTLCVIKLSWGKGSCMVSAKKLPVGTYRLGATYGGSVDFDTSTSAKESLAVAE